MIPKCFLINAVQKSNIRNVKYLVASKNTP